MASDYFSEWERLAKADVAEKLATVFKGYGGRPVAEVRAALKAEGFTDPDLSEIAEGISKGREPRAS